MEKVELCNKMETEIFPGFYAKFVHSDNVTISYVRIDEGADAPEHAHPHEQICQVIEGKFELTVEGKTYKMETNDVVVIPSNVKHSAKAFTACKVVDTFYPIREDFKKFM
ncbi:MAG: cupin domain-containing protein [Ignavibacteria bacterium]|nr:cupin domain-containing protein [Ignavibacteria bacterium]MBT8382555.1 cupin domain-containing protein [Ignavibacteria bacterium]MBT8392508.1 cupin domain-containing protein [Ignavibacteria bacterium]NNJ53912.1 cupin domain-containing protein [Ignavibacteriaceae bacterium]NNL19779.1 cupin domain-containing protein [Ignavibacteriaceae bacterium]